MASVEKVTVDPVSLSGVTREVDNNLLYGESGSPYNAQGRAHRYDVAAEDGWEVGKVLVANATSPADMLYLMTSEGVVTKLGGRLSHAAVVCRELGKACVVGIDIEKIDHEGSVLINGKLGSVALLGD